MNITRSNELVPRLSAVNETPSRESLPSIVALALGIPNATWSIGYLCHDQSNRWLSVSQAGAVPPAMRGFAIPVLRLPATIDRALRSGSIEHSRLLSIWIRDEISGDLSDEDLDLLSSVVAMSMRMGDEGQALLLIGTRDRSPDLTIYESFREDMHGALPASEETEGAELEASDDWSRSASLVTLHNLLVGNIPLFHEFLGIEMMRGVRYHRNMSLFTFTVRHAEKRNIPEDVLTEVAKVLRARLRPMDIIGRATADTIGAVLPETSEGSARWLSPRLRIVVTRYLATIDKLYTLDIGVASKPHKGDTPAAMVELALRRIVAAPLSVEYRNR